jgi:rubrerythrin
MNKIEIESRLRQLLATDMNAHAIYADIALNTDDQALKNELDVLAKEEEGHIALTRKLISLLNK